MPSDGHPKLVCYVRDQDMRLLATLLLTLPLAAAPRPNVVLVLADDQGWGEPDITGIPTWRRRCWTRWQPAASDSTDFTLPPRTVL